MNWTDILKIFGLLLVLVERESNSDCTPDEIIRFNSTDSISEKYFLEYGSPTINITNKCLFDFEKFTFSPHYTVIGNSEEEEEGFYVISQELNDVTYHLYGETHPKSSNYKLNVMEMSVVKCLQEEEEKERCEELKNCSRYNKTKNENADDHIVCVAWQKINKSEKKILLQYENHLLICSDNNAIITKKFVMYSNKLQNVSSAPNAVKYMSHADETLESEAFTFPVNRALYFQISQCKACALRLELHCDNYCLTKLINGTTGKEWTEIRLPGTTVTGNNCKLSVTTRVTDTNQTTDQFWAVTPNAVFLNTTMDTDKSSEHHEKKASDTKKDVNNSNTTGAMGSNFILIFISVYVVTYITYFIN